MLVSGYVFVGAFAVYLSAPQLLFALLVMPPAYTLAEAFAPHTWDTPFLLLVGFALLAVMEEVPWHSL